MEQDLREQLAVVWRALHSDRHGIIREGIEVMMKSGMRYVGRWHR